MSHIPRLPRGFSHPMLIGEGGFSSVYRVRQIALDRWVALKIIREKDTRRKAELLKEARVHADIRASCIPQIYDVFEGDKSVILSMEWIRGVSLSVLLENDSRRCTLTDEQRLAMADGIIRALAALHELGFAHRDLKPANILISPACGVYLLDFGFSMRSSGARAPEEEPSSTRGTPAFMAPELYGNASPVDYFRADVYSAGKILRTLLSTPDRDRLCDAMLSRDPALRLANGPEALRVWQRDALPAPAEKDWNGIAGQPFCQQLSRLLFSASCKLIDARRYDEAYWLLTECVEVDPEYPDAAALLGRVPGLAAKRGFARRCWAGVSTALLIAAVATGSFFAGRSAPRARGIKPAATAYAPPARVLMQARNSAAASHPPPFCRPAGPDELAATLKLYAVPAGGALSIDNRIQSDSAALRKGIRLAWGAHVLAWRDAQGVVRFKEHVRLLPFQTRRLSVER